MSDLRTHRHVGRELRHGGRRRGEGGQSTVELALCLPFVVLLLAGIGQVTLVIRDQVAIVHAAREGARAAAVDDDPAAARRAVLATTAFDPDRLDVRVTGRAGAGSLVTVSVRYRAPTDMVLVGPLLGDYTLVANTTMRVE